MVFHKNDFENPLLWPLVKTQKKKGFRPKTLISRSQIDGAFFGQSAYVSEPMCKVSTLLYIFPAQKAQGFISNMKKVTMSKF